MALEFEVEGAELDDGIVLVPLEPLVADGDLVLAEELADVEGVGIGDLPGFALGGSGVGFEVGAEGFDAVGTEAGADADAGGVEEGVVDLESGDGPGNFIEEVASHGMGEFGIVDAARGPGSEVRERSGISGEVKGAGALVLFGIEAEREDAIDGGGDVAALVGDFADKVGAGVHPVEAGDVKAADGIEGVVGVVGVFRMTGEGAHGDIAGAGEVFGTREGLSELGDGFDGLGSREVRE